MEHMESIHTPDMLILFGIEALEQYGETLDINSEEQGRLR